MNQLRTKTVWEKRKMMKRVLSAVATVVTIVAAVAWATSLAERSKNEIVGLTPEEMRSSCRDRAGCAHCRSACRSARGNPRRGYPECADQPSGDSGGYKRALFGWKQRGNRLREGRVASRKLSDSIRRLRPRLSLGL